MRKSVLCGNDKGAKRRQQQQSGSTNRRHQYKHAEEGGGGVERRREVGGRGGVGGEEGKAWGMGEGRTGGLTTDWLPFLLIYVCLLFLSFNTYECSFLPFVRFPLRFFVFCFSLCCLFVFLCAHPCYLWWRILSIIRCHAPPGRLRACKSAYYPVRLCSFLASLLFFLLIPLSISISISSFDFDSSNPPVFPLTGINVLDFSCDSYIHRIYTAYRKYLATHERWPHF